MNLIVLDILMPQTNGPDAFSGVRVVNPRLKALLLSGFSLDNRIQAILDHGALGYLEKPFCLAELYDKVSEALSTMDDAEKTGDR